MNNKIEFQGRCAFAVSTGKTGVMGGSHTSTINGKAYAFSNLIAKLLFKILPGRIKKADQVWNNRLLRISNHTNVGNFRKLWY